jgi:hypothetical protein
MKPFNSTLLVLLLPFLGLASDHGTKPDRSKSIEKNFTLDKDGLLEIQNSFGNVTITTWDKESVYFKITVEVTGGNDESINKRLRDVDVIFNASTSKVSARTNIDENNSMWSWIKGNNRTNLKINYEVYMPVTAHLDVRNDYGTISLDKLRGSLKLRCDFGRIAIGQLLHNSNDLQFDYTKNSHIDYMRNGTIKADFSTMKVYGSEKINLTGDYSTFKFESVKTLDFNTDFSTVDVEKVIEVLGRGDYSTLKFGLVIKNIDLKTDFGSIDIKKMDIGFKNVQIRTEYTKVSIGYDATSAFDFMARVEYASLKISDNLNVTRSENDYEQKLKAGYNVKANAGSTMELRSEFGTITLREM